MTGQGTLDFLGILTAASPLNVFTYVTFVVKVAVIITLSMGGIVLFTLIRRERGVYSNAVATCGRLALIFGLFASTYSAANSYLGFLDSSPHHAYEKSVAIIAAAYVLLPGLIIWLIAQWGNAGAAKACPVPSA